MTQIQAELAQDRNAIDARASAQVFRAFKPMLHDLSANWFSRLEFTHQKAIQVNEDFLGTHIVSARGSTCLKKCLKPKGQRAAKKTGSHRFILSWARASILLEGFSDPPWHR
jgi:hypothetical protein